MPVFSRTKPTLPVSAPLPLRTTLLSAMLALLALNACSTRPPKIEDAQYWQRAEVSSALYTRGPKAQQMLHQDIARCTHEINELIRLGSIRRALPADSDAPAGSPQKRLDRWDTPERDGALYGEHLDYTDFETCMAAKGWERVENLPYDVAERARKTWLRTVLGEKSKERETQWANGPAYYNNRDDWDNLNE